MTRIISVDGNIGSGKSTFVAFLKDYFSNVENRNYLKICFLQEPVNQWNEIKNKEGETMIECFYKNTKDFAFAFQMMAYISRLHLLREEIKNNYDIIITERCLYTDKNVFCKMLYDDNKINEIEYQIYNKWFNEFNSEFSEIEYIYIQTSPEIAFDRILKRGRQGEIVPLEYLQLCNKYHEQWLENENTLYIDGNLELNEEVKNNWILQIKSYTDIYLVTFDGASRGNPGVCGAGFVIWKDHKVFYEGKHCVSQSNTNNYAEYSALLLALLKCQQLEIKNLIVKGDSNLIIKQVTKEFKIQSENLIPLYKRVLECIKYFKYISFEHIEREKNKEADRLANLAINAWGKKPIPFDSALTNNI